MSRSESHQPSSSGSSSTSAGISSAAASPSNSASSSSTSAGPSSTSSSTNAPSSISQAAGTMTSNPWGANGAAASMEVDTAAAAAPPATAAASSTAAAPAAASSSSASPLSGYVSSIENDAKKTAEGVLRHLSKMLAAVKKSPNLLATRKFRADNIAVKKFVMDVPGALSICEYVGFAQVELTDKKTPYLVADEATLAAPASKAKLDEAIEAVGAALAKYDAPAGSAAAAAPAAPAALKQCAGGCGFWGSPDTEGYCSLCFKKRFLGGAGPAAATPAKPSAAAAAASFSTPPKGVGSVGAVTPSALAGSLAASAAAAAGSSASAGGVKCPKHCGRDGSDATKGFCAPCYALITAAGAKAPPPRWKCLFDGAMVKLRAVHRFNKGKKPIQTATNRCWTCQKKIGITGFQCRCRYVFCAQHRYMEQHNCTYDIKSLHRAALRKENEEIRAAKIIKL